MQVLKTSKCFSPIEESFVGIIVIIIIIILNFNITIIVIINIIGAITLYATFCFVNNFMLINYLVMVDLINLNLNV